MSSVGLAIIGVVAVHVVVQRLVEPHAANLDTELHGVVAEHLADVVRSREAVAYLRQLAFEVVANGEPAGDGDEGNAFEARSEVGSDAELRVIRIAKALGGIDEAAARALYEVRLGGMFEAELTLAHVRKASFVHDGIADGPGVREIVLLDAGRDGCSEARYIGSRCLEKRERLVHLRVVDVVIEAQVLRVGDTVVEFDRSLVATRDLRRCALVKTARLVG